MADLQSKITQYAPQNTTLLRTLSETDHALPQLTQQNRLIADLRTSLAESDQRLKHLSNVRKKEFHDHEKYRDSFVRRLAYKIACRGGEFNQRAEKEEREYFEALQLEHKAEKVNANLKQQLAEATAVADSLSQEVKKHDDTQAELDRLYNSIFAGATPDVPEEDEKERDVERAMASYQDARGRHEAEMMAVQMLGDAQRRMRGAMASMEEALNASRYDMFSSGGFADMLERNALHRAELEVMAARMAVQQAQRMSPAVGELPAVEINQGHLIRDVFFDNVFTDMAFHEEIKRSAARVQAASRRLDQIAEAANARRVAVEGEMRTREKELINARHRLQKVRERVFETLGNDELPAYSVV
ncbi:hypothetical protein OQA88_7466 [Cercophora sp. LCS_1]